jgi:hypothetical protein
MNPVAAAAGDSNITIVMLSVLIALVVILGVVLWFFIRQRIKEMDAWKKQQEAKDLAQQEREKLFLEKLALITGRLDSRDRSDDVLEKRLAAGADSMSKMKDSIQKMQDVFVDFAAKFVSQPAFESFQKKVEEKQKEQEREIRRLYEGQNEIRIEIRGIGSKVEQGLKTISDLLAPHVHVGKSIGG